MGVSSPVTTPRADDEDGRELACVVLSLENQPGLVDAVRSVVDQAPHAELVVVNSGGGDASATLSAAGVQARVVERQERLLPGGARNEGILASRARWVAFLAADCLAESGWVEGRLRAHRAGAPTVASAITNTPDRPAARAAYLLLHARRMPDTPPGERIFFGLSYDRGLFDRFGLFRDDMREGEDSEFNARLECEVRPQWAADVRTAHRHPPTLVELVRDQYGRGRRTHLFRTFSIPRLAFVTLNRPLYVLRQASRVRSPEERRRLLASAPWVLAGTAAYAAGLLAQRHRRSDVLGHTRSLATEGPQPQGKDGHDDDP